MENIPISNKKGSKLSLHCKTEFVKRIKWNLFFVSHPGKKMKQIDLISIRPPSKMIDNRNFKKNISSIWPEMLNLLDNDLQIKLIQDS